MNEIFIDTTYALAMALDTDNFHAKALELSQRYDSPENRFATTRGVMMEIGNALSKVRHRKGAAALMNSFEADPRIEIVPLSEELNAKAFALYQARPDKEWGMVDCISFVVMQERGMTDALTSDEHFRQAGFRPLMREI